MSPEELVKLLDGAIEDALSTFEGKMPAINEKIISQLEDLSASLEVSSKGTIKANFANLKTVNKYKSSLDLVIKNAGYTKAVNVLTENYGRIRDIANEYFSSLSNSFSDQNKFYTELLKQNIETTTDSLLASGIDANFKNPIIKLLRSHVTGQSSTAVLRNNLRKAIMGSDKTKPLMRWTSQVANDSVMQYERNYLEVVSSDLDLDHYLYAGTRIADSRQFCIDRIGKYFTGDEVRSWAKLTWAGKIPGTDETNIKTLLGGYNCRHRLIPVSKELYILKTGKKIS